LAAKPPAAVQASKRLMKGPLLEHLQQAVKLENEVFAERVRSDDAKRAFQAFFAKRKSA
jgi:enoyl-CoA hydratase/carnithine racemase